MKLKIYDNEGLTCDRYTVFIIADQWGYDVYSMSADADKPNGVCIYLGNYLDDSFDKEISFNDLPQEVKNQIIYLLTKK